MKVPSGLKLYKLRKANNLLAHFIKQQGYIGVETDKAEAVLKASRQQVRELEEAAAHKESEVI